MKKEIDVKKLFLMIESRKGSKLSSIFSFFACQENFTSGSVRNIYYKSLKFFESHPERAKELGVDLSKHKVAKHKKFSTVEQSNIINEVTKFTSQGLSVRKACLELSGGDIKKMVRYQNKVRSMNMPKNIMQMPKRNSLSDNDINSLFLGLVKLIKKSAALEADKELERQIDDANEALRRNIVELTNKERELMTLKRNFEILKNEKLLLKEKLGKLRANSVNYLYRNKLCKVEKLKSFMKRLERTEEKQSK